MKEIVYSRIKPHLYAIERDGRVYSYYKQDYMKTSIDKDGYSTISLKNPNGGYSHFGIHRLLMIAYYPLPNMEELQVNHKDGNKQNNNLSNLEWVTCEENLAHARTNKLNTTFGATGESHPKAKLTEEEALDILTMWNNGIRKYKIIQQKYPHASNSCINALVHRRTWKHLDN